MPIFMKYGGIKGSVIAVGHEDWIELHSFQWGAARNISSPIGGQGNRQSSAPSISEVVVTKEVDVSSTKLLGAVTTGAGVEVIIDFVKTDKGNLEVYMTYTLTDTMISGYSVSSGGDRPTEAITLNFTKIDYKYTPSDAGSETGSPDSVSFDSTSVS